MIPRPKFGALPGLLVTQVNVISLKVRYQEERLPAFYLTKFTLIWGFLCAPPFFVHTGVCLSFLRFLFFFEEDLVRE